MDSLRIAVILPCYNEEAAIAETVAGFRAALPDATIYVYDNNSSDRTVEIARAAGAVVRTERQQGKGHVVRRMFADVDADIYVMADGDLTYDPKAAPEMVRMLVDEQLDMVVGTRQHEAAEAYRGGHVIGNRLFTGLLAGLFGRSFTDIFSGYRVFSRRFVKSFPVLSRRLRDRDRDQRPCAGASDAGRRAGHGLWRSARRLGVEAIDLSRRLADPEDDRHALSDRAAGAVLRRAWRAADAGRGHPRRAAGASPISTPDWCRASRPRSWSPAWSIVAVLSFFAGLILDTVTRGRREMRRLAYLAHPARLWQKSNSRA